jgi:hypothetical protein
MQQNSIEKEWNRNSEISKKLTSADSIIILTSYNIPISSLGGWRPTHNIYFRKTFQHVANTN